MNVDERDRRIEELVAERLLEREGETDGEALLRGVCDRLRGESKAPGMEGGSRWRRVAVWTLRAAALVLAVLAIAYVSGIGQAPSALAATRALAAAHRADIDRLYRVTFERPGAASHRPVPSPSDPKAGASASCSCSGRAKNRSPRVERSNGCRSGRSNVTR